MAKTTNGRYSTEFRNEAVKIFSDMAVDVLIAGPKDKQGDDFPLQFIGELSLILLDQLRVKGIGQVAGHVQLEASRESLDRFRGFFSVLAVRHVFPTQMLVEFGLHDCLGKIT